MQESVSIGVGPFGVSANLAHEEHLMEIVPKINCSYNGNPVLNYFDVKDCGHTSLSGSISLPGITYTRYTSGKEELFAGKEVGLHLLWGFRVKIGFNIELND